jgi:hypothetical protein
MAKVFLLYFHLWICTTIHIVKYEYVLLIFVLVMKNDHAAERSLISLLY